MTIEEFKKKLQEAKKNDIKYIGIDNVLDFINEIEIRQKNFKKNINNLLTTTNEIYNETNDPYDMVKAFAYENVLEFFKCDIEKANIQ